MVTYLYEEGIDPFLPEVCLCRPFPSLEAAIGALLPSLAAFIQGESLDVRSVTKMRRWGR
jgi:hypothetical protein